VISTRELSGDSTAGFSARYTLSNYPGDLPPDAVTEPLPSSTDSPAPLDRKAIQRYVWSRYVEHGQATAIDESEALQFLENYYRENALDQDAECFYYGILAYEHSFATSPDRQNHYLRQALEAFKCYRAQTQGFNWDVVDDRYEDTVSMLQPEPGPA